MRHFRFLRVTLLVFAVACQATAGSIAADKSCEFCSTVAFLDENQAQCFLDQYEDRVARLARGGRGFVSVDTGKCRQGKNGDNKNVMNPLPEPKRTGRLFLTREYLDCAKSMIEEAQKTTSFPIRIAFDSDCQAN